MEQGSHAIGRRLGFRKPLHEQAVPDNRDSEAAHSTCGMLPCGVSDLRCGSWRLVQPGETDTERQTASHPRRTAGRCREVRSSRLAHVPPYVSFVAGRDRSADEGAAGTHASCLDPDDDERLWAGHDIIQAGSKQQGRGDGAQACKGERLKPRFCEWESVGVNLEERSIKLSLQVTDLIGCGGRI